MIVVIPGFREAVERERKIRNQSYLDDIPETLCGIEVKPLTLRKLILLGEIESPFVVGGHVTPYHIGAFFVVMTERTGFSKWRLLRQVSFLSAESAIEAIKAFMDEAFQDSPPQSEGEEASYYSFAASLVDVFASQYGWTRKLVVDSPLKCIFQELKSITKRNRPDAIMFNPSDRVRGEWLAEMNRN